MGGGVVARRGTGLRRATHTPDPNVRRLTGSNSGLVHNSWKTRSSRYDPLDVGSSRRQHQALQKAQKDAIWERKKALALRQHQTRVAALGKLRAARRQEETERRSRFAQLSAELKAAIAELDSTDQYFGSYFQLVDLETVRPSDLASLNATGLPIRGQTKLDKRPRSLYVTGHSVYDVEDFRQALSAVLPTPKSTGSVTLDKEHDSQDVRIEFSAPVVDATVEEEFLSPGRGLSPSGDGAAERAALVDISFGSSGRLDPAVASSPLLPAWIEASLPRAGISEAIARQLNRFGIFIAHKPASSVRATLSRVKDPIPKEQQTNVIYRIPCANCSCDYVGHTGRRLGTRINEHKLAIRRRDPLSLVFAHALECDHRFNWEGTEVVAMANTKHAREFLEAWHSNTTSINRHVDLDAHYEGLRARLTDLRPRPNNSR
nr:unnamed protein product [Spirometra erinaceieuropaei]